jgi:hypothetical protein
MRAGSSPTPSSRKVDPLGRGPRWKKKQVAKCSTNREIQADDLLHFTCRFADERPTYGCRPYSGCFSLPEQVCGQPIVEVIALSVFNACLYVHTAFG